MANMKDGIVLAFGAGMDFTPHMALASIRSMQPWVAYYHDPYPLHLYPPPYCPKRRVPGVHQERWHRRIVERSAALAFPSSRLLNWVLSSDLERYRDKAFVLPHLALDPTTYGNTNLLPGFETGLFNIVHTGTILRHRSPWALIEGFRKFLSRHDERRRVARLWLVGGVDRHITTDDQWTSLSRMPEVRVVSDRLPYNDALCVSQHAVANVVLEAVSEVSPFFPGKLADYLTANRPILAITPAISAVRDILGCQYPLLCPPDDAGTIAEALEKLWKAWCSGGLAALNPGAESRWKASTEFAAGEFGRMLLFIKERTR